MSTQPDAPLEMRADDEKLRLEKAKLGFELKKLSTPWWRDPDLWVKALPLPLSIIALIATIYTSSQQSSVTHLKIQQENLQSENARLSAEKKDLQEKIASEKVAFESDKKSLRAGIQNLHDQENRLKATNKELEAESREFREKLQDEKFDTNLTLVLHAEGTGDPLSGRMPYPIRHLIEIARSSGTRKQYRLSKLEGALKSASDIGVRIAIVVVLYEGTHAAKWSDALAQALVASYKETQLPPISFENLQFGSSYVPPALIHIELSTWSHHKKVEFCETLYRLTDWQQPHGERTLAFIRREFFSGDHALDEMQPEDARFVTEYLVVVREIVTNRNLPASDRIIAANYAGDISKEAAMAFFGTILADEYLSPVDRHRAEDFVAGLCGESLEDLTPCPTKADAAAWKQWKLDNASTLDMFFQPMMPRLVQKFQDMFKTE